MSKSIKQIIKLYEGFKTPSYEVQDLELVEKRIKELELKMEETNQKVEVHDYNEVSEYLILKEIINEFGF